MLRRVLGEDIELIASVAQGLGQVSADSGQLEQVILNLAVNARDAMPQGGRLILEAINVELDAPLATRLGGMAPGQYIRLTVSTGQRDWAWPVHRVWYCQSEWWPHAGGQHLRGRHHLHHPFAPCRCPHQSD